MVISLLFNCFQITHVGVAQFLRVQCVDKKFISNYSLLSTVIAKNELSEVNERQYLYVLLLVDIAKQNYKLLRLRKHFCELFILCIMMKWV